MLQLTLSRMQPPGDLTPAQAREFRRVVELMPPDWFSEGYTALLAQYCRHVTMTHYLAAQIERETDGNRLVELLQMQADETKMLSKLMTALRLTPRSMNLRGRTAPPKPQQPGGFPWSKVW